MTSQTDTIPMQDPRNETAASAFYQRLLAVVDGDGRFAADPQVLLAACYEPEEGVSDREISIYLTALESGGLIELFQADSGRLHLAVLDFSVKWFRLYSKMLRNYKVQSLEGRLFRGWINLLCVASANDGSLPNLAQVAFELRISEAEAAELIERLVEAELFDRTECGALTPHRWNEHQHRSGSSTERVRKHREKQNRGQTS